MGTATLISVEEYLHTHYDPDCDFVDGRLEERNVGKRDHSQFQMEFGIYLGPRKKQLRIHIFSEQRLQVSATRVRIPDVCVVAGPRPEEDVFTKPPFICLEILSESDRLTRLQARLDDYLDFGVPNIWVVDPTEKRAWSYSAEGLRPVHDRVLRATNPDIVVALDEIFAEME